MYDIDNMSFEDKVLVGGLGVLLLCLGLIGLGVATETTVLWAALPWAVWLALHNRITKTFAIATLLGLLASVALGVPLGLLVFGIALTAFWYAWI